VVCVNEGEHPPTYRVGEGPRCKCAPSILLKPPFSARPGSENRERLSAPSLARFNAPPRTGRAHLPVVLARAHLAWRARARALAWCWLGAWPNGWLSPMRRGVAHFALEVE